MLALDTHHALQWRDGVRQEILDEAELLISSARARVTPPAKHREREEVIAQDIA